MGRVSIDKDAVLPDRVGKGGVEGAGRLETAEMSFGLLRTPEMLEKSVLAQRCG